MSKPMLLGRPQPHRQQSNLPARPLRRSPQQPRRAIRVSLIFESPRGLFGKPSKTWPTVKLQCESSPDSDRRLPANLPPPLRQERRPVYFDPPMTSLASQACHRKNRMIGRIAGGSIPRGLPPYFRRFHEPDPRSGRLAMMPRGVSRGGRARGECSLPLWPLVAARLALALPLPG